jgi:hypothetical protein
VQPPCPYVQRILGQYQSLPGTLCRVLRDDRRTAAALHARRVPLRVVENAFALAIARRTFRKGSDQLEPIRALRYFLPVIQEIVEAPAAPGYYDYLRRRLQDAGISIGSFPHPRGGERTAAPLPTHNHRPSPASRPPNPRNAGSSSVN